MKGARPICACGKNGEGRKGAADLGEALGGGDDGGAGAVEQTRIEGGAGGALEVGQRGVLQRAV